MKKKHLSSLVRRVITCALCAMLCLSLFACGQKAPQYEAQSGVTYTQLMSDMNRQIVSDLSAAIPDTFWWDTVGGHVVAYGANADAPGGPQPHLLADIDPENENFTTVALTLPEVPANTPGIAATLAAQQAAAETGVPLQRDAAAGYDVATRTLVALVENADGQLFSLLVDTLRHFSQDEAGHINAPVTERAVTLCNLNESGTVQPVAQLQIPQEYLLWEWVADNTLIAPDNTLWITACDLFGTQCCLLRFSLQDGSLLTTLPMPEGTTMETGGLIQLSDDRLLALTRNAQMDTTIGAVSLSTEHFYMAENITSNRPSWREAIDLPAALQGSHNFGFVPQLGSRVVTDDPLLYNEMGIYSLQLTTGEATQLLNWADYGVQPMKLAAVFALGEGRYLIATRSDTDTAAQVQVLTPLDPEVVAGRTILTFGRTYYSSGMTDPIQEAIAKFNAESSEYYIQVIDYEEMSRLQGLGMGNGDYLLNQAVIDNEVPDILMIPSTMGSDLLQKGLTVDLYPYIDADPELARENFLPNILTMTEIDGKLPTILAAYDIETLAGDSAVVGDGMGWDLSAYQALCADTGNATPVFQVSRSNFLTNTLSRSGDVFANRTTHQANFLSPDFVALLESSAAYPAQITWNGWVDPAAAVADGSALLADIYLAGWENTIDALYLFGDGYVYKGYPSDGSATGSTIRSDLQLGISSTCQHPDVAWQLVRTFLLPEFQNKLGVEWTSYPGFPLRQDSLQTSGQSSLSHLTSGVLPSKLGPDVPSIYIQGSQADVDKVIQLIQQATTYAGFSDDVGVIVSEEAEAFYNGQRTAEEAAEIIQNRVQTYLDEQG